MTQTATACRKVTPPELAARWGISPDKILFWIQSGELRAIDASLLPGRGRPRYLIDEDDIEAFERGRQVAPPLPQPARRRKPATPPGFVRHFRSGKEAQS